MIEDPLEFYGYEDETNARAYRKHRRMTKIDKWRSRQVRPIEDYANRLRRLFYGMPAIG